MPRWEADEATREELHEEDAEDEEEFRHFQWKEKERYGMIILVEDSLGWQNRLIDKASVQFRLTTKYKDTISQKDAVSFFIARKEVVSGSKEKSIK